MAPYAIFYAAAIGTLRSLILQSPVQAQSLLRIDQVAERVQYGRSSIWAMVKAGTFPAPVKLSRRCTRWTNVQVDEWIRQRIHPGGSK